MTNILLIKAIRKYTEPITLHQFNSIDISLSCHEYEVEFVTDCNVVKWKDYIIDGSNPQGTPNITVQSVKSLEDTTAFKRIQGIPKTSKDSQCISCRTKSTSFGCFSWEPAFHLKECQTLIGPFEI